MKIEPIDIAGCGELVNWATQEIVRGLIRRELEPLVTEFERFTSGFTDAQKSRWLRDHVIVDERPNALGEVNPHRSIRWERREADILSDVVEFHRKYRVPLGDRIGIPSIASKRLRRALIAEEMNELLAELDAEDGGDIAAIAKEGVDVIYVVLGMFATFNIPFAQVWDLVHASNMTKEPDPNGGKIRKGEDYESAEPDIRRLVERLSGYDG